VLATVCASASAILQQDMHVVVHAAACAESLATASQLDSVFEMSFITLVTSSHL